MNFAAKQLYSSQERKRSHIFNSWAIQTFLQTAKCKSCNYYDQQSVLSSAQSTKEFQEQKGWHLLLSKFKFRNIGGGERPQMMLPDPLSAYFCVKLFILILDEWHFLFPNTFSFT